MASDAFSQEEVCQIGYYDEEINETVLYCLLGFSVEIFGKRDLPSALDILCFIPDDVSDEAFLCAFGESGRIWLEFVKKHRGLSFHEAGKECIDFLSG